MGPSVSLIKSSVQHKHKLNKSEQRDGKGEKEETMEIFTGTNTNKRFEKVCGEKWMENETETEIER